MAAAHNFPGFFFPRERREFLPLSARNEFKNIRKPLIKPSALDVAG